MLPATQTSPAPATRAKRIFSAKIVPQLDTYPGLVEFVQTPLGKIAAAGAFGILLAMGSFGVRPFWLEITVIACLLSFFPRHRRALLSFATLYWLLRHYWYWLDLDLLRSVAGAERLSAGLAIDAQVAAMMAAMFCAVAVLLRVVRQRGRNLVARRPVLVIVGTYTLLLTIAGAIPLQGFARLSVWMAVVILGPYMWYFAYAAADQHSKAPDPYWLQFGTFLPFWRGANVAPTPIGKGATYLRKVEAKTPGELAVAQLKAIKLLIWLLILTVFLFGMRAVMHGESSARVSELFHALHLPLPNLAIPTLPAALDQTASGIRVPFWIAWISVLSRFIEAILEMTITGNTVVACCRMAGFQILRNTYKPVYSTSIAEFWNRYYYYFKELLVDFFFFPTYTRYFKKHRRLRLAAATLAAATFGNMLYHFGRDIRFVYDLGLWKALAGYQVYAFYTVLLGCGIVISQLRSKRSPHIPVSAGRRMMASVWVLGFYALLGIFAEGNRAHPLGTHMVFFFRLFGI